MKRYWKLALIPFLIFLVGAMIGFYQERKAQENVGKTYIRFPFAVEQVDCVEVFYYTERSDIDKYIIDDKETVNYLYSTFESIALSDKPSGSPNEPNVTVYRFNLDNSNKFELIYEGYGVKNGVLTLLDNSISYFTSADLNRLAVHGLDPVAADESELPN